MKKILFAILCAALCCAAAEAATVPVQGKVSCEGVGIAGVWVSDGVSFACTDADGCYTLNADPDYRYVFVSVPSGYDAPVKQGVVQFFDPIPEQGGTCDFTLTKRPGNDEKYGIIVTSDPQIWASKEFKLLSEAVDDIVGTVNSYKDRPFIGICCGDIVSSNHNFYNEYCNVMAASGIDFHHVQGNHDMTLYFRTHENSRRNYEQQFGPGCYSFNVGKIHYVVLNDNFYIGREYFYVGYIDERQFRWLETDLSHVEPGSTVVLCMHIPSTCTEEDRKSFKYDRSATTLINHVPLHRMLAPYKAHIFSGHTHTTFNVELNDNLYEHVIPSVGGAWWQGTLCTDGTPRGYTVFEVDGDDLRWYYKSTGYPKEYQMKLYDGNTCPEFAGYAVANIWGCDSKWTVEFEIDGKRCAAPERFEAYDPDARKMYSDTSGMDHKWIYPSISDHYYRVPLPAGACKIKVTATDGFGNRSVSELKLNK